MGLLSALLLAPVTLPVKLPVAGTVWLGRKLAETAEAERDDPASLRAALTAAEQRLLSGEITETEYDGIETEILTRLKVIGS